jgi:hypothetical protein
MDKVIQQFSEKIFRSKWTLHVASAISGLGATEFQSSALIEALQGVVDSDTVYRMLRELVQDAEVLDRPKGKGTGRYRVLHPSFFEGCANFKREIEKRKRPRSIRAGG